MARKAKDNTILDKYLNSHRFYEHLRKYVPTLIN